IENKADITIATRIDIQGVHPQKTSENVKLKTIPTNAPMTIKPSNPIFTTPDRSLNTPPNAVNIKGAEKKSAVGTIECNTSNIYFSSFLKRRMIQRIK